MRRFLGALLVATMWTAHPVAAGQDDSRLPRLFERLKVASAAEAPAIQEAIWEIWVAAPDDLANLMMLQGMVAMQEGRLPQAIAAFSGLIEHSPDLAEGWNKRATAYFLAGRFDQSVQDIERTLRLEPRHFGALAGLGQINLALGRTEAARQAFEQALAVNPHLDGVRSMLEEMKAKAGGKGI
jgi:tetratricopeptide (TPR) repeat protein